MPKMSLTIANHARFVVFVIALVCVPVVAFIVGLIFVVALIVIIAVVVIVSVIFIIAVNFLIRYEDGVAAVVSFFFVTAMVIHGHAMTIIVVVIALVISEHAMTIIFIFFFLNIH